jgi:uncharacterized oxidoreductase
MQTSNNTILITGGATGIGLALTEQLSRNNTVIICGRREAKLFEAKQNLPRIHTKVCDLQNEAERIGLVDWVIKSFPELNIVINNAGIQQELDLTTPDGIDDIRQEVEINFIAPVHLCGLLIPHLRTKSNSAVINISSGLAFTPIASMPIYCATKAAMHSFSLSLRHQLSKTSVKVFEIAPPIVDTDLDKGRRDTREGGRSGIKPEEFAVKALEAMRNDTYEAAIGFAENLRLKREEMFGALNH